MKIGINIDLFDAVKKSSTMKGRDLGEKNRPGEDRRAEVNDKLNGKLMKQEVNYRPSPIGSGASCSNCKYYKDTVRSSSTCSKVAGTIEASDICDHYEST